MHTIIILKNQLACRTTFLDLLTEKDTFRNIVKKCNLRTFHQNVQPVKSVASILLDKNRRHFLKTTILYNNKVSFQLFVL